MCFLYSFRASLTSKLAIVKTQLPFRNPQELMASNYRYIYRMFLFKIAFGDTGSIIVRLTTDSSSIVLAHIVHAKPGSIYSGLKEKYIENQPENLFSNTTAALTEMVEHDPEMAMSSFKDQLT